MRAYDLAKPALYALPAETAHETIQRLLRAVQTTPIQSLLRDRYVVSDERLETDAFGVEFPTPVGVAAGFDKNARVPRALAALGFGHVEVGGVTAERQPGNPRPRMVRLREDEAIVNRMGFNNEGADRVGDRLDREPAPDVPLGVNVGKSKSTPLEDAADDYLYTYERVGAHADYVAVNVSSPNTPGLRSLQNRDSLEQILGTLSDAGADPLLVKFSPDLPEPAVEEALAVVDDGVGGGSDAAGAYAKIRNGASLVQLYTGLVYEGPSIARDINEGLAELLERDGFDSVADAVGADL